MSYVFYLLVRQRKANERYLLQFYYLSIDKQLKEITKIDKIFEDKTIFIYREFIKINNQFVNNIAKLNIVFINVLTIKDFQVLKLDINFY